MRSNDIGWRGMSLVSSLPGTKAQASCHQIDLGRWINYRLTTAFAKGVQQATRARINETVAA